MTDWAFVWVTEMAIWQVACKEDFHCTYFQKFTFGEFALSLFSCKSFWNDMRSDIFINCSEFQSIFFIFIALIALSDLVLLPSLFSWHLDGRKEWLLVKWRLQESKTKNIQHAQDFFSPDKRDIVGKNSEMAKLVLEVFWRFIHYPKNNTLCQELIL